jgi:hypothetical protein
MLTEMPGQVKVPFQAMVDDGLQPEERLTLVVLYGYADAKGVVNETPTAISVARSVHPNSTRRHLKRLQELGYLIPLHRASRLERTPLRKIAEGFALTLRPDGERWDAAPPRGRIGSARWASKKRWGM